MEMLEYIFLSFLFLFMGFFAYMSCHIVEEEKQGKRIPLPWETK
mgnify:CR=1 FL=1